MFRKRVVPLGHQRPHQLRIVLDDAGLAPDLDALAVRVIDQEQKGLRVVGEVALGDALPVAAVAGEGDGPLVQHPQEPGRPAAMLNSRAARPRSLCRETRSSVPR